MPINSPPSYILPSPDHVIRRIIEVHKAIRCYMNLMPEFAFLPIWLEKNGKLKLSTAIDLLAEQTFIKALTVEFGIDNIFVIGEESVFDGVDLSNETRMTVLIDMIDGTDLLKKGFSNWCSAICFFQPDQKKIKGAYVAFPDNYLYYATDDKVGAFKKRLSMKNNNQETMLTGPSSCQMLQDASICMYSQKSESLLKLLSLNSKDQFVNWLSEITKTGQKYKENGSRDIIGFRFYNLAGNPMMVKLGESVVDIVVDLKGQAPHDVVPGAFIARKAGAVLGKVTGEFFTIEELSEALLRPSVTRIKYILAANDTLLKEFSTLLK